MQKRIYWSEEPSWFKALRLFSRPITYLTFTPVQVRVAVGWHVLRWVFGFGSAGHAKSVGEDANAKGAKETKKIRRVLDFNHLLEQSAYPRNAESTSWHLL